MGVRPEYDVKLLQGGRTVRVLLNKNRYAPAPDKWGLIKTIEYTTQRIWPIQGW